VIGLLLWGAAGYVVGGRIGERLGLAVEEAIRDEVAMQLAAERLRREREDDR
jgi:hypothetical protein